MVENADFHKLVLNKIKNTNEWCVKYDFVASLKENKRIVENQNEVAYIFSDYFSKVVSLLQIPESNNIDSQSEWMSCPTLKLVMKYRRHPSITAIQDAY